jgi:hypothetical protein
LLPPPLLPLLPLPLLPLPLLPLPLLPLPLLPLPLLPSLAHAQSKAGAAMTAALTARAKRADLLRRMIRQLNLEQFEHTPA